MLDGSIIPHHESNKATEEDKIKLDRIINYLRDNDGRGITLTPGNEGIVASGYFDGKPFLGSPKRSPVPKWVPGA